MSYPNHNNYNPNTPHGYPNYQQQYPPQNYPPQYGAQYTGHASHVYPPQQHYPHQAPYPPYNASNPNHQAHHTPYYSASVVAPVVAPVPVHNVHVEQWCPPYADNIQIGQWFKELDKDACSIIKGAEIVQFLRRSNLSKEILRAIWAIVDSENKGFIDRAQFNTIVRLVSISCSPIYMGASPTMERYYATIRDHIALPSSLSIAPPSAATAVTDPPHVATVAAAQPTTHLSENVGAAYGAYGLTVTPAVVPAVEEDEFTDFTAAQVTEPTLHYPVTTQHTTAAEPMLHFEDDTDDFGPMASYSVDDSHQSAQPTVSSAHAHAADTPIDSLDQRHSQPVTSSGYGVEDLLAAPTEEDDDMGDFTSYSTPQAAASEQSAVVQPANVASAFNSLPVEKTLVSRALSSSTSNNNLPLSELEEAVSVDSEQKVSSHANHHSPMTLPAIAPSASSGNMSAFDDLVENDLKALAEDWDDFAEADPNAVPASGPAASVGASAVPEAPIEIVETVQAQSPVLPSTQASADMFEFDEEEEDFGGFESASPAPDNIKQSRETPVVPIGVDSAPIVAITESCRKEEIDFGEEDFGDFGDFESPSPQKETPATGSVNHQTAVKEEEPLDILFDLPPVVKQSAPVVDLLDFLDEPVPIVAPSLNNSGDLFSNNSATFADPAVSFDPFGASDAGHDAFDPFSTGSSQGSKPTAVGLISKPPQSSPAKQIVKSIAIKAPSTSSASKPSTIPPQVNRKPLSLSELELLSLTLSEKHLYEEAYACVQQTTLLRTLGDLLEQKRMAMENDELELAVQLKKDIALIGKQVESADQEAKWEQAAKSNRKGDTIHETYNLVNLLNPAMGAKFKAKFLVSLPSSSAPLENRMKFFVVARRYARMIVAVNSTHPTYPAQWLKLLTCVARKMTEGKDSLARFRAMKPVDQLAVTSHPKMSDYIKAIVSIAELGMWVSASCDECFQNEREARMIFNGCNDFLQSAHQIWNFKSECVGLSVADMALTAAKLSERSGVTYCNITLRPISVTSPSTGVSSDGSAATQRIALYPHCSEVNGAHFMKPAVNLWLKDVSSTLPVSDCNFA